MPFCKDREILGPLQIQRPSAQSYPHNRQTPDSYFMLHTQCKKSQIKLLKLINKKFNLSLEILVFDLLMATVPMFYASAYIKFHISADTGLL